MRRSTLASLLVVAILCVFASASSTAAKSYRLPVDYSDHTLVGEWLLTTAAGTVPATFGADGSVVLEFPATVVGNDGIAFVSTAVGTWQPAGAAGAGFTAVQNIAHANGVFLGTITTAGHLTVSDDGMSFVEGESWVSTTTRDANNAFVSMADTRHLLPAVYATRIVPELAGTTVATGGAADPGALLGTGGRDCISCAVAVNSGPADQPVIASGAIDPGPFLGNGGRDCATCAVAYNIDSVAEMGVMAIEIRSAGVPYAAPSAGTDAGPYEAHGAALFQTATAADDTPATIRNGGGCNTCR